VDAARLAAGGDSAGANLALGAALALRDAGHSPLSFLLLVYGVYSTDADSDSWQRLGTGAYGLARPQVAWILENYLASPAQRDDWRVAPLHAPLHGLPPVHGVVGTLDPLWDDNHALAQRLDQAGVRNELVVYEGGLNHGFIRYGPLIRTAKRAVSECAAALACALAR
jgi:acetyl esterase